MLVPSIFGGSLLDDFGDFPFGGITHYNSGALMKTDIRETDNSYALTIDMPGVNKEDVTAELKDGYLTVSAESSYSNDDKNSEGRYIRRERHYGSFRRSFYIGDAVKQDEVKASFENGTLKLTIPKKDERKITEGGNRIRIN